MMLVIVMIMDHWKEKLIKSLITFLVFSSSNGWLLTTISQAHHQQCRVLWSFVVLAG
jgi:hypothetical protein